MPNWSDLSLPADNIITRTEWLKVINNLRVANDFLGSTGGSHQSFGAKEIMLGNGQGVWATLAISADGTLLVGDGVTTPVALTVGSDDTVLRGDSGQTEGVLWEEVNWNVAEVLAYG